METWQHRRYASLIRNLNPKILYLYHVNNKFGADAVSNFNMGIKVLLLINEKLGMIPGIYIQKKLEKCNAKRLPLADSRLKFKENILR